MIALVYSGFVLLVVLLAIPLGLYMARVFSGERTPLHAVIRPVERLIYRAARIDEQREVNWKQYAWALLLFNLGGFALLYLILVLQGHLPLNPQHLGGVSPALAFNTTASFTTNTNWQAYAGEATMSHFSQMAGMTVQNFLSAATGLAVLVALIRGVVRRETDRLGNFWVDVTRGVLYVLLPLALVLSIALLSLGVIQNYSPNKVVTTVTGETQEIAMGPVASQEAIKQLGTNGGGFFNANSAHPFENPTPATNFLELLAILLLPAACCVMYGKMAGNWRHGVVLLLAMLILFAAGLGAMYWSEARGNPRIAKLGVSEPTAMEGKEVRNGVGWSALWGESTTAASNGSTNSTLDSYTPAGGMVALANIMLGEVIFGGIGVGLTGMIVFALVTVFIVGLMVGRTPEYLGKKIEAWDMKMAVLVILIPSAVIMIGAAIAAVTRAGTSATLNPGPHGLSEMLYAWSSGAGNNGSAFAGLDANTAFYNLGIGVATIIGRFGTIIPVLAIAGSLAKKKSTPLTAGTFETTGPTFTALLVAVVLVVGALTFFAALSLGPIVEQLLM
ncbi:MAG: potassium-transporting ATPase subunit KdpA [Actinomycetota bacterium]